MRTKKQNKTKQKHKKVLSIQAFAIWLVANQKSTNQTATLPTQFTKKAMRILKIAKSSARTLEEKKNPAQTPKQVTNRQP